MKENDIFSVGQPLSYPFNIEDNEGGACISIDNNLLFFTKCSKVSGNYNNCDIFYSEKNDGKWGEIQSFGKEICPMFKQFISFPALKLRFWLSNCTSLIATMGVK